MAGTRITATLILALLLASAIAAETPDEAAEKVLAANDAQSLKALATRDKPDPWRIADVLCRRGKHDEAKAFALAAPREAVEELPGYVDARRAATRSADIDRAVDTMVAAYKRADWNTIANLKAGAGAALDSVPRIRLEFARGVALRMLRNREAAERLAAAARAAEKLGWFSYALRALAESGQAHEDLRNWKGALETHTTQLALARRIKDSSAEANALFDIGSLHSRTGNRDQALQWLERAKKLYEALEDRRGLARTLNNIGIVHDERGERDKARRYLTAALTELRALGDKHGEATALNNLGALLNETGKTEEALRRYEQALRIRRELQDKAGIAQTLGNIGRLHLRTVDPENARPFLREALALRQAGGNKREIALAYVSLGNMHSFVNERKEAIRHFELAIALLREVRDGHLLAKALNNVGADYKVLGRFAEARRCQRESIEIARQIQDANGVASALDEMAAIAVATGDFNGALVHFESARKIFAKIGNTAQLANVLDGLSIVHRTLGDFPAALGCHEEAIRLARGAGQPGDIASALYNMGNTRQQMGDNAEALRKYEQALALAVAAKDQPIEASITVATATLLWRQQKLEAAQKKFEGALVLLRDLKREAGIARTLANLANVYSDLGQHDRARECVRESIKISHTRGDAPAITSAMITLANVEWSVGKLDEAERIFRTVLGRALSPAGRVHAVGGLAKLRLQQGARAEALELSKRGVEIVARMTQGLAEGEGGSTRDMFADMFEVGIRAAAVSGDVVALSWFVEHAQAGSLREALGAREALHAAVLGDDLRKQLSEAQAKERTATADEREAARQELEQVVARIQREAKAAASLVVPEPDSIETIHGYLRPDEAIVHFRFNVNTTLGFVIYPDGAHAVALDAPERIRPLAARLLRSQAGGVTRSLDVPRATATPDPAKQVAALRKILIEPLKIPAHVKRLLICPVGELGYVPFSMLFPDKEIAYIPSGTVYGLLLKERDKRGKRILALGDPNYGVAINKQAVAIHRGGKLARLPATRKEVEAIADVGILGDDATETGLRSLLGKEKRWRAVHFACHGVVNPEHPLRSSLALTADAQNDGFLTALEVFRLKVPADLVVLSACETGKGKAYKTEGIIGLTRSFMFAGAPRVICSLWKVDDDATRALMVRFYELWNPKDGNQGLGAAAALKKAQEFVRSHKKWERPHFWAAWVLWGLPD